MRRTVRVPFTGSTPAIGTKEERAPARDSPH